MWESKKKKRCYQKPCLSIMHCIGAFLRHSGRCVLGMVESHIFFKLHLLHDQYLKHLVYTGENFWEHFILWSYVPSLYLLLLALIATSGKRGTWATSWVPPPRSGWLQHMRYATSWGGCDTTLNVVFAFLGCPLAARWTTLQHCTISVHSHSRSVGAA